MNCPVDTFGDDLLIHRITWNDVGVLIRVHRIVVVVCNVANFGVPVFHLRL